MICRHCGKEYSAEFAYCPYCAEPKPEHPKNLEREYARGVNREATELKIRAIITGVVFAIASVFFLGPIGLLIAVVLVICIFIYANIKRKNAMKPGKKRTINMQFTKDPTSICPSCGSHNIKIYRKGYNYGHGFWGAIFGVRGAGYAAGIDSNKACCRCMNCGNDWETDYDYRLINK